MGTIISKTFYYPLPADGKWDGKSVARTDPAQDSLQDGTLDLSKVRLIETRLLVRRQAGWQAMPYVWNDAQTGATLKRAGELVSLELVDDEGKRESVDYQVPDQNQCASCHATDNKTRALHPIGPKARHLNRDFAYASGRENQLAHLSRIGYLTGAPVPKQAPRNADWRDAAHASLEDRARAYLDVNCGHCHSPTGPAITSGHVAGRVRSPTGSSWVSASSRWRRARAPATGFSTYRPATPMPRYWRSAWTATILR